MTLLLLSSAEIQGLADPCCTSSGKAQPFFIVAVYAMIRGLVGRLMSAQGRYLLASVTLLAMAVTPLLTFLLMPKQGGVLASVAAWTISASAWQRLLPAVVAVWLAGVILYSIRLFGGWRLTTAPARNIHNSAPAEWRQRLGQIADGLAHRSRCACWSRSLVNVPTVIRMAPASDPAVTASLAGLPAEHLAALLAHEGRAYQKERLRCEHCAKHRRSGLVLPSGRMVDLPRRFAPNGNCAATILRFRSVAMCSPMRVHWRS